MFKKSEYLCLWNYICIFYLHLHTENFSFLTLTVLLFLFPQLFSSLLHYIACYTIIIIFPKPSSHFDPSIQHFWKYI